MSFKNFFSLGLGLLAVLPSGSLLAQTTNLVTVAATARIQGQIVTSGRDTLYTGSTSSALNTGEILRFLAQDEHAAGRYSATNFPSGARLAVAGPGHQAFLVLDRHNNLLADVSNVLKWSAETNRVYVGRIAAPSGLADPRLTEYSVLRMVYDDSAISGGVGLYFTVGGMATRKVIDTAPNRAGYYLERVSNVIPNAVGSGNYQGQPFTLQGEIVSQGKASLVLGQ